MVCNVIFAAIQQHCKLFGVRPLAQSPTKGGQEYHLQFSVFTIYLPLNLPVYTDFFIYCIRQWEPTCFLDKSPYLHVTHIPQFIFAFFANSQIEGLPR